MQRLTRWSVQVVDATSGEVLFERHADRSLRTASIGKLLLLDHVSASIISGVADPHEVLTRTDEDRVADSGLWQYLATDALPVADLCELVGGASDNLAANVLLRRFSLADVAATAARNGLRRTALHDRVRDVRGPADPPTLSTGSAAELTSLLVRRYRERIAGNESAARLLDWLAKGLDLSMVASGWGLDPLAHKGSDRGLQVWNKTGTDAGVRAETGLLAGPARTVGYTAIANWDPGSDDDRRGTVLRRMRRLGRHLERAVRGAADW